MLAGIESSSQSSDLLENKMILYLTGNGGTVFFQFVSNSFEGASFIQTLRDNISFI